MNIAALTSLKPRVKTIRDSIKPERPAMLDAFERLHRAIENLEKGPKVIIDRTVFLVIDGAVHDEEEVILHGTAEVDGENENVSITALHSAVDALNELIG
jgi:hypothetical protein